MSAPPLGQNCVGANSIYYLRIVLPDRLATALGQREFVRSLGVRSPMIARISGYQIARRVKPLLDRVQDIMATDPNSMDPSEVRKLIAEGLGFRPDGALSIGRIESSSDPKVAEQKMHLVSETAKSWRELHRDSHVQGLSEEALAQREAEALRLRDELAQAVAEGRTDITAGHDPGAPLRPSTLREAFNQYLNRPRSSRHSRAC